MPDLTQEEVEDKIIDLITLGAKGRLVVFKPENSDIDLVVEKKGDYNKDVIFLKIFNEEPTALKYVDAPENLYSVFVNFDKVKQELNEDLFIVSPDGSEDSIKKNDFARFLIDKIK